MMAKIASLFGTEADATQALDTLAEAGFSDTNLKVISSVGEAATDTGTRAALAPQVGAGVYAQAAVPRNFAADWDLSAEEAEFFIRGVRNGGVLVLLDVQEERVGTVRRILQDGNGRTSQQV